MTFLSVYRVSHGHSRDLLPDDVTAWLEDGGGDPYLLLLDPAQGILLLEVPASSSLGVGRRAGLAWKKRPDNAALRADIRERAGSLETGIDLEDRLAILPVGTALALPGVQRKDLDALGLIESSLPILTAEDFREGTLRDALARVLGTRPSAALTDLQERIARGILHPDIIISGAVNGGGGQLVFRPPEVAPEEVIRVLDRKQELLARHLGDGYRIVRGVAGSGKTLVLTHRAKYVAEFFPNLRVLLLCYNKALSLALEQEVRGVAAVEVKTVDGLAYRLVTTHGRHLRAKTNDDFAQQRSDAAQIARNLRDADRFDMVFVDEAQDLDTAGLNLAYAMLKSGRDDFVMALDSAQNIFRRRMTWNPPGKTARGRTTLLRVNYRNTREILEFAMNFLTGTTDWASGDPSPQDPEALVPPEAATRSGPGPKLLDCSNSKEEAAAIAAEVDRLRRSGVDPDSIAVMYGSNAFQKQLYWAFKQAGLPYFGVQQSFQNKRDVIAVHDVVRSSTLQGLKGLEFSRVLLGGVNQVWVPGGGDDTELIKRLLYVGMTRAMDELTITVSGDGPIGNALRAAA